MFRDFISIDEYATLPIDEEIGLYNRLASLFQLGRLVCCENKTELLLFASDWTPVFDTSAKCTTILVTRDTYLCFHLSWYLLSFAWYDTKSIEKIVMRQSSKRNCYLLALKITIWNTDIFLLPELENGTEAPEENMQLIHWICFEFSCITMFLSRFRPFSLFHFTFTKQNWVSLSFRKFDHL